MLKTSGSTESSTRARKSEFGVDGDSRAGRDRSKLDRSRIDNGEVEDDKVGDGEIRKKVQKLSKSKNLSKSKKTIGSDFLTPRARLAFTKLRQVFVKTPILHYIDLKHHNRIETDESNYAINRIFRQLTLNDSS